MTIDCTLDSLKIPALPTYINEFGTKKSGGGLTTAECADDAMLPFRKMRAYTVNESSETTEIQHNAVFIMTAADTSLVLHDCSANFLGCEARVINTSSGNVTVLGGVSGIDGGISGVTVPPEREARFVFLSDGWHSSYDSLENITEKELADSSVSEDKIADGAVTSEKIKELSVGTEKIADGSVTSEKLASGLALNVSSIAADGTVSAATFKGNLDGSVAWGNVAGKPSNIVTGSISGSTLTLFIG